MQMAQMARQMGNLQMAPQQMAPQAAPPSQAPPQPPPAPPQQPGALPPQAPLPQMPSPPQGPPPPLDVQLRQQRDTVRRLQQDFRGPRNRPKPRPQYAARLNGEIEVRGGNDCDDCDDCDGCNGCNGRNARSGAIEVRAPSVRAP